MKNPTRYAVANAASALARFTAACPNAATLVRWCVVACVALVAFASTAHAQRCDPQWLPGDPVPGTDGMVYATALWDPDGPGPRQPLLIVAGTFSAAGNIVARNIAAFDLATSEWSQLGPGLKGTVRALAVLPNGDLVAGGSFAGTPENPINGVARWNGTTWMPLGQGTGTDTRCFAVLPNGDLIAGGSFVFAGSVLVNHIAHWNGSTWSPLGQGVSGAPYSVVNTLVVLPNGDVIAGGYFDHADTVPARSIARWNGSTWSALGDVAGGSSSPSVDALAVLPSGDVIAGGIFATAGGAHAVSIARWNGAAWSAIGSDLTGELYGYPRVQSLSVTPTGELLVGGRFTGAGTRSAPCILRWNAGT